MSIKNSEKHTKVWLTCGMFFYYVDECVKKQTYPHIWVVCITNTVCFVSEYFLNAIFQKYLSLNVEQLKKLDIQPNR